MNTLAAIQPLYTLTQIAFLLAGSLLLWFGGHKLAKLPKATFGRSLLATVLIALCYLVSFIAFSVIAVSLTDGDFTIVPLMKLLSVLLSVLISWLFIKLIFKSSWPRAILAWLPTLIITAVLFLFPGLARPKSEPIPLEISYETTRILGPLNPDGTVNYLEALNDIYSKGATRENNAAIPLLEALGPVFLHDDLGEQILARLDMPQLPPDADYFIFFIDYKEKHQTKDSDGSSSDGRELLFSGPMGVVPPPPDDDTMPPAPMPGMIGPDGLFFSEKTDAEKAAEAPWSPEDYPLVPEWLDANERPLALIVAASQRPRYYIPMLSPDDPPQMTSGIIPAVNLARESCRALLARAMLKAGSGQIDQALADILAVHRLARLVGQGPLLVERLLACSIEGIACDAEIALAVSGNLNTAQARGYISALQALEPLPNMTEPIDVAERFMALDIAMFCYRNGFQGVLGNSVQTAAHGEPSAKAQSYIDANQVLLTANAYWDHMVLAAQKPTSPERREALALARAEVDLLLNENYDEFCGASLAKNMLLAALGDSEAVQSNTTKAVNQLLLAIMLPSLDRAPLFSDLKRMQLETAQVSLALAAYKAEHGRFPQSLSELCPEYFKTVPENLFTAQPLHYQPTDNGYILSSPGPYNEYEYDDILVQVPVPVVEEQESPEQQIGPGPIPSGKP